MKILLVFICCIMAPLIKAQQLDINQLAKLRTIDAEQANDYLTAKGWAFTGTEGPIHVNRKAIGEWGFKNAKIYGGYSAKLSLSSSVVSGERCVMYMTIDKGYYDFIKREISINIMEKISTESFQPNCIETTYKGDSYRCRTSVCKQGKNPVIYIIFIQ